MDTTELELKVIELEEKINKSRNAADIAAYADELSIVKKQISDAKLEQKDKEVKIQKEAAARIDHVDNKHSRGDIVNSGDTFTTFI